jgi:hypothetical protein
MGSFLVGRSIIAFPALRGTIIFDYDAGYGNIAVGRYPTIIIDPRARY